MAGSTPGREVGTSKSKSGIFLVGASLIEMCIRDSGQAVQVGHHVQAVVIGLQECPVAHRADVVAQSRRAGGLNARKNAFTFFFCHYDVSPL